MKRSKLILSLIAGICCLAMMCFGVYAATTELTFKLTGSITYECANVKATIETAVYQTYSMTQDEAFDMANKLADSSFSEITMSKAKHPTTGEVYYHKYTTGTNTAKDFEVTLDFTTASVYFLVMDIKPINASADIKTVLTDSTTRTNLWTSTSETEISKQMSILIPQNSTGEKIVVAYGVRNTATAVSTMLDMSLTLSEYDPTEYLTFTEADDLSYVSVAAKDTSISGHILIPETYNGLPVTTLASGAFKNCASIKAITLPENLTTINMEGFYGCTSSLQLNWNATNMVSCDNMGTWPSYGFGVYFGRNVETIPSNSFFGASNMMEVYFRGNKLKSIGTDAFYGCTSIWKLRLPSSLTEIGNEAFAGCTFLSSVDLTGLTYLGEKMFSGCTSLNNVTVPKSIVTTGEYVFKDCSGLTNLTLESGLRYLGGYMFYNCDGLTEVTIPNTIKDNGEYPFSGCNNLLDVTLEKGLTFLGKYMLGQTFFTSITIPGTIVDFEEDVFSMNGNIKTAVLESGITTIPAWTFSGCYLTENFTIPSTVTYIGKYAFQSCSFTSITIPSSVLTIEERAFYNCTLLETITFNAGCTSIGSYAFYGCRALSTIKIPNSVTYIGRYAFQDCSALTSITVTSASSYTWMCATNPNASSQTTVSLATASTNKTYFTSTYVSYYWKRVS